MKKLEEPRDRLSELPDSLIFEIFGLLPLRDFVRTTILSKRWKNLWTTTPYLDFDWRHDSKFIYRALILWKGSKILKFKFSGSVYDTSLYSDIDVWVRLAMENGVEDLVLSLHSPNGNELYDLPHYLYSCGSLKVLFLVDCKLLTHENVQWNQLKSLMMHGCCILDEHLINQIVSGSPQLEVFTLNFSDSSERDDNLSIRSSSLKKLLIERYFDDVDEPYIDTELRIWSPNLETLAFIGVPYAKYSLLNISSLTHVTLDFSSQLHYMSEILCQILSALQHVEKFTISDWCIKMLGDMKEKYLLSPLSNFKFLTIKTLDVEHEEILDLLQIFPKLETLVFQSWYEYDEPSELEMHATNFLQVERNLPESFLLQLRTIEINCVEDEEFMFTFIEILLKCACKLQKMVIRLKRDKSRTPPMCLCLALQKLLRMPRSSPTAELIVVEAVYPRDY